MEDLEDFTYVITPGSGPSFHVRELCPKDFYFAQILRQKEASHLQLVSRLILNQEILDNVSARESTAVFKWIFENVLEQNVFSVENWLELSYHLCKQRWDSSVDWLEAQPMSKIQAMIQIVQKHAEEQEKEMKKSARRKK